MACLRALASPPWHARAILLGTAGRNLRAPGARDAAQTIALIAQNDSRGGYQPLQTGEEWDDALLALDRNVRVLFEKSLPPQAEGGGGGGGGLSDEVVNGVVAFRNMGASFRPDTLRILSSMLPSRLPHCSPVQLSFLAIAFWGPKCVARNDVKFSNTIQHSLLNEVTRRAHLFSPDQVSVLLRMSAFMADSSPRFLDACLLLDEKLFSAAADMACCVSVRDHIHILNAASRRRASNFKSHTLQDGYWNAPHRPGTPADMIFDSRWSRLSSTPFSWLHLRQIKDLMFMVVSLNEKMVTPADKALVERIALYLLSNKLRVLNCHDIAILARACAKFSLLDRGLEIVILEAFVTTLHGHERTPFKLLSAVRIMMGTQRHSLMTREADGSDHMFFGAMEGLLSSPSGSKVSFKSMDSRSQLRVLSSFMAVRHQAVSWMTELCMPNLIREASSWGASDCSLVLGICKSLLRDTHTIATAPDAQRIRSFTCLRARIDEFNPLLQLVARRMSGAIHLHDMTSLARLLEFVNCGVDFHHMALHEAIAQEIFRRSASGQLGDVNITQWANVLCQLIFRPASSSGDAAYDSFLSHDTAVKAVKAISHAALIRVRAYPQEVTPPVIRNIACALADSGVPPPEVLDDLESIGFAQLGSFTRQHIRDTAHAYQRLEKKRVTKPVTTAFADDDVGFAQLIF